MYAALQPYSLGLIPSALILFFWFSIYFVSTTKFTLYFILFSHLFTVLCHLFSLTLSLITVNVRCWSVSGYLYLMLRNNVCSTNTRPGTPGFMAMIMMTMMTQTHRLVFEITLRARELPIYKILLK